MLLLFTSLVYLNGEIKPFSIWHLDQFLDCVGYPYQLEILCRYFLHTKNILLIVIIMDRTFSPYHCPTNLLVMLDNWVLLLWDRKNIGQKLLWALCTKRFFNKVSHISIETQLFHAHVFSWNFQNIFLFWKTTQTTICFWICIPNHQKSQVGP